MKKIIILALALIIGHCAFAQQKGKTDYMSITVYHQGGQFSNMIVTRTDSLQKIIDLKIKFRVSVAEKKFLAEQDSILLQLVKPYYDKGWKLVSFATDGSNFDNNSTAYRYYLAKDQQ